MSAYFPRWIAAQASPTDRLETGKVELIRTKNEQCYVFAEGNSANYEGKKLCFI